MAIGFRASSGGNNAGGAAILAVPKPSGVQAGDVVVLHAAHRGGSGTSMTPSGWTPNAGPGFAVAGIAYGNSLYVAGGTAGGISTSPDGVTWTGRTSPFSSNRQIRCIEWDGTNFVAWGTFTGTVPEVATSTNGTAWTLRTTPFSANSNFGMGLAYDGAGNWVFVGTDGGIASSNNGGVNWAVASSIPAGWGTTLWYSGVAYGNGVWFLVGRISVSSTPKFGSSTDGDVWTDVTVPGDISSANVPQSCVFGDGVFLAVASGGTYTDVWTSSDASSFTKTSTTTGSGGYWPLKYANGTYLLQTSGNNQFRGSRDGSSWALYDESPKTFIGLAWGATYGWVCGAGTAAGVSLNPMITWTALGAQQNSTTVLGEQMWWRIAATVEPNYGITLSNSQKASGVAIALSGADPTQPVAAQYSAQVNASSATASAAALGSWTSCNGIDLMMTATATGTTVLANPTNYSLGSESASTGGGASSRETAANFYRSLTGVTTVGALTHTYNAAAVNIGQHLFIKEYVPVPSRGPAYIGGGYYG